MKQGKLDLALIPDELKKLKEISERSNTANGKTKHYVPVKNNISEGSNALKDFGIAKVEKITDSLRRAYKINSNSEGLVITELDRNSKASTDDEIREGDLLIEVNGQEVKVPEDIKKAVGNDEFIVLMFERDGLIYFIVVSKN